MSAAQQGDSIDAETPATADKITTFIQRNKQRVNARAVRTTQQPDLREPKLVQQVSAKMHQLSLVINEIPAPIDDDVRNVPNALARTALFTIRSDRDERAFLNNVLIAAPNNVAMLYKGEELRQDDAGVWLQMIYAASGVREKSSDPSQPITFTVRAWELIETLGWANNKTGYQRLFDCLQRLIATALTVEMDRGRSAFIGSLLSEAKITSVMNRGKVSPSYEIQISRTVVSLFAPDAYSRVTWSKRLATKRPLAQWLMAFYSTHRDPLPIGVYELKRLSGSQAKHLYHFREILTTACKELTTLQVFKSWHINTLDQLVVERQPPTPALAFMQ
ncbi:MAG: hypothetical protein ING55_08450 [Rhodocyclaceae bacterium]|jgi:hypothetical protein|nr:hypothetical protein [Rhodocyclaceae bacterium]